MEKTAGNRRIALCLAMCLLTGFSAAAPISMSKKESASRAVRSLDKFRRIVILDRGRLKPLDTYAENMLLQFSGRKTVGGKPAIYWLARTLLAPVTALSDKVLFINNPEIAGALGIAPEGGRRYGFGQIMPRFHTLAKLSLKSSNIPEKQRSPFDVGIIRLAENENQYSTLLRALSFAATIPQLGIFSLTDTSADTLRAASNRLWSEAAATYGAGDQEAFDYACGKLAKVIARSWPPTIKAKDPGIELMYNTVNSSGAAEILLGISLLALIAYVALRFRRMHAASPQGRVSPMRALFLRRFTRGKR